MGVSHEPNIGPVKLEVYVWVFHMMNTGPVKLSVRIWVDINNSVKLHDCTHFALLLCTKYSIHAHIYLPFLKAITCSLLKQYIIIIIIAKFNSNHVNVDVSSLGQLFKSTLTTNVSLHTK